MTSQPVILVVDDEEQIRQIVAYMLTMNGYQCLEAATASEAWQIFTTSAVDAIILDVMLPDMTGIDLCTRIRATSFVPILLLSALADEDSRICGLEAGADDYVIKPFSPKELGLRVGVLLRRSTPQATVIGYGDLSIDPVAHTAVVHGQKKQLPITEAKVLAVLLAHAPNTVSVSQLLSDVWNTHQSIGGPEMVRITVHRLRTHLREVGAPDDVIATVRGKGYKIVHPSRPTV